MNQTDGHLFAVSGCGCKPLGLILRGIVTARDALHFASPQAAAGKIVVQHAVWGGQRTVLQTQKRALIIWVHPQIQTVGGLGQLNEVLLLVLIDDQNLIQTVYSLGYEYVVFVNQMPNEIMVVVPFQERLPLGLTVSAQGCGEQIEVGLALVTAYQ